MSFDWFNRFNKGSDKPQPQAEEAAAPAEVAEATAAAPEVEAAPAIAEDYLSFAKAAYENLKRQQALKQEEAAAEAPVTTEPPQPEAQGDPPQPQSLSLEPSPELVAAETMTTELEAPVEPVAPVVIAEESASEDAEELMRPQPIPSPQPIHSPEPIHPPEPIAAPEPIGEPQPLESPQPLEEPESTESLETAEAIAPEPEPVPAQPFWMETEAQRQARLERLTAPEVVVPVPVTTPSESQPVEVVQPTTASEVGSSDAIAEDLTFDEGFRWSAEVLAAQGRRAEDITIEEITWLKRLRQGLDKTRRSLINQLKAIVGQGPLDQNGVMEIEALLLQADVGVEATDRVIEALQAKLRQEVLPPEQAISYLKTILREILDNPGGTPCNPVFAPEKDTLNIWLITGVNGAGKTTTIGKIAHIAQKSGYRCLIAAADTFRAAAVEQVKIWGQRSGIEVIANPGKNTDPAAVVYDAIAAAQSREIELLLVDTAGRLQNKKNLMDELGKIRRIVDKKAPNAHIESLLVLDATLGQNGLRQAQVFSESAQLTGVVLTKLDGTAKGGVALAVVQQLGLPIRFIGAGERVEDLRPFSSYEFVEALLNG